MAQEQGSGKDQTTFDELLEPLQEPLAKIEEERLIHHLETFAFTAFVRLLIYYFVKASESGRQLLTETLSASEELGLAQVKRSTFFDAFNRFPVKWFVLLLTAVLTTVSWKAIPELDALGKLYCIDGSIFPGLAHMLWAEYTSKHRAVRLHLCFELNRMIPVQFLVQEGNSNEKSALRQMLETGVTYIADRGYVDFHLLADIVNIQAHFVFRMKANLVYTVTASQTVDLPEAVSHIFTQVTDQRVKLTNADGEPIYRLVTFLVGNESYLVLTDRLDLTTFQVILLYAYRWQVELIFRFLKRSLNGLHLISTSENGVTIHFYALMIAALLQLRLKQACVSACEAALPTRPAREPESSPPAIACPGLMIDPNLLASARGHTFLATVGMKLQRYWKISVHWLVTLRNLLARPLERRAIHLLGHT